jgi:predicted ABC-type ATPase
MVPSSCPRGIETVAERLLQGDHHIPEDVIRRRFAAGLRNLENAYKSAVDAWAEFDNVGDEPILFAMG